MIQMTMQLSRRVILQEPKSVGQSRAFLEYAHKIAPSAPIPAASLGVASPPTMLPKTTTINEIGRMTAFRDAIRSSSEARSAFGTAGPISGQIAQTARI